MITSALCHWYKLENMNRAIHPLPLILTYQSEVAGVYPSYQRARGQITSLSQD